MLAFLVNAFDDYISFSNAETRTRWLLYKHRLELQARQQAAVVITCAFRVNSARCADRIFRQRQQSASDFGTKQHSYIRCRPKIHAGLSSVQVEPDGFATNLPPLQSHESTPGGTRRALFNTTRHSLLATEAVGKMMWPVRRRELMREVRTWRIQSTEYKALRVNEPKDAVDTKTIMQELLQLRREVSESKNKIREEINKKAKETTALQMQIHASVMQMRTELDTFRDVLGPLAQAARAKT